MRFELTTTRITAWRSNRLSYGHRDDGWNRTSFSGLCRSVPFHSATSSSSRHKAARRTGIEPVASRFGVGRSAIGTSGASSIHAQGGTRTPAGHRDRRLYRPEHLPLCHLRVVQRVGARSLLNQEGRIRTCGPVLPRHVLYQTELLPVVNQHSWRRSQRESNPRRENENLVSSR